MIGGLVPYWITGGWDGSSTSRALLVVGAALLVAGAGALAHTVIRFAVEGLGTPFPAAPTEKLVVGGSYRYVRNPMYIAVIAIILGQAAILGSAALLLYASIIWVTVASFVRFYGGADAGQQVRRPGRGLPPSGQRLVAAGDAVAG